MKSIRKTYLTVSCCESCPHFFKDGWLLEGQRFCTHSQENIEKDIDLETEVSDNCPLEEA
jgi:hypothetical protein